jgi:tetratricopeptide (TPR) repeat protein
MQKPSSIPRRALTVCLAAGLAVASGAFARQDHKDLPRLFQELRESNSPEVAYLVERRIWDIWTRSERDDVDRLMALGRAAMSMGDNGTALSRFDEVVKLDPNFAEGINKRATVHFLRGDWDASLADIESVLALEAKHFGAIEGRAMIYERLEKYALALESYEQVLTIHPHARGVRARAGLLRKRLGQHSL